MTTKQQMETERDLLRDALGACVDELQRLRELFVPIYLDKIGEPSKKVVDMANAVLRGKYNG